MIIVASSVARAEVSPADAWEHAVTKAEFDYLLHSVYCPSGAMQPYLSVGETAVLIRNVDAAAVPLSWPVSFARVASARPSLPPLAELHVAIDPGHIGGRWARVEERFFVRGDDRPVMEGVLTLMVAKHLKQRLEAAGCRVTLARETLEPTTPKRPNDYLPASLIWARKRMAAGPGESLVAEAVIADMAQKKAELLFYRSAEINARARALNEKKPDLTLVIHFNAVPWNQCQDLVDENRLLFFVHGCYLSNEVADSSQRLRLLNKLFSRDHYIELGLAEAIAQAFHEATGLLPAGFTRELAVPVGDTPFVYARNLAGNRLIDGPVIYLEPYFMNSRIVYERIQAGDYLGTREIMGRQYPSIFREYADAVVTGILRYYAARE